MVQKRSTEAAASDSMAFGSNAKTKAANAVAWVILRATATDAFAFGNKAYATGANAIEWVEQLRLLR